MANDKTIGRNRNSSTEADIPDGITLNSSTPTTVAAKPEKTDPRIFFAISNTSDNDMWLLLRAASIGNDKKGIFVPRNSYWEMPVDNIYDGEISAIAVTGTPQVFITQY